MKHNLTVPSFGQPQVSSAILKHLVLPNDSPSKAISAYAECLSAYILPIYYDSYERLFMQSTCFSTLNVDTNTNIGRHNKDFIEHTNNFNDEKIEIPNVLPENY